MLKLKIQLDPKNAKQMLALSSFAAVLADVSDNEKQAIEGVAKLVNEAEPEAANYYGKPKSKLEYEARIIKGPLNDLAPSGPTKTTRTPKKTREPTPKKLKTTTRTPKK